MRNRGLWTASLLLAVLLLIVAQMLFMVMRPSLVRPFVYFLSSAPALVLFAAFSAASDRFVRVTARLALLVEGVHLILALSLLEGWAPAELLPLANANWYVSRSLLPLLLVGVRLELGRTGSAQSVRVLASVAAIFAVLSVFPTEALFHARAIALVVLNTGLLMDETVRLQSPRRALAGVSLLVVSGAVMSAWMSWAAWTQPPERVWAGTAVAPVVLSAAANDPRIADVAAGVAYWNAELRKIHSRFRLGSFTHTDHLAATDRKALQSEAASPEVRRQVRQIGPSILVVLSDDPLTSFVHDRRMEGSVVVMIAPNEGIPSRPNVMRNIVAHELGHAIGLSHNDDSGSLMCGAPAPCHIRRYESALLRTFPLGEKGEAALRRWYEPR